MRSIAYRSGRRVGRERLAQSRRRNQKPEHHPGRLAVYTRIDSHLQLTHVSAHVGTEGNELADRMAMFAVVNGSKDLRQYGEEIDIKAILRMRRG